MLDFIDISLIDVLDVALVGLLFFEVFRLFRGTSAMGIFLGIFSIYVIWIVVKALGMKLLSFLLGQILGVGVIALIIIFQQEIRSFLFGIGKRLGNGGGIFQKIFRKSGSQSISDKALDEITEACGHMSEGKTGALIVMAHNDPMERYIATGDEIDAALNSRVIENIFFKNTPLHDGAGIMTPSRIVAARCTLPMSSRSDIPPRFGMRHKAAIGMSEVTDATVIVVSEETGEISFVKNGEMKHMENKAALRAAIADSFNGTHGEGVPKGRGN